MRIVVPTDGKNVAQHFGQCPSFTFFDVEDSKVINEETVANPGHRPGFLPNFLGDKGAEIIISGGMGGGAVDIFNERNIEVVMGASGDAKTAVESYLAGNLKSTGSICHDHAFHNENCEK